MVTMHQSSVPLVIGRTISRRHLTGLFALNVPGSGLCRGGDWHQFGTWFGTAPERIREVVASGQPGASAPPRRESGPRVSAYSGIPPARGFS